MSWHYRIRKRAADKAISKSEFVYDVVEYYSELKGWTSHGVGPTGDTPDELYKDLHRMHESIANHPILDEEAELARKPESQVDGQEVISIEGALWGAPGDPAERKDA